MQEQILAALKKLGPSSPGAIADHLETEAGKLSYHFKQLLDAGTMKATGSGRRRQLALADQAFAAAATEAAPPQRRKKHKKAKHAKPARRAAARRAPRAAVPAERFIPTVDAERRLVIVNGGEPLIFSDAQTEAIATLLFTHYDKA
jgi:DNA-binding transcriptional ArsR family regulator